MKINFLTAMLVFYSIVGFSQTEDNFADKKLKFGFNIGTSYSNVIAKEPLPEYAQLVNGVGFKTGIFMEYALTKNIQFSPKIELSFNDCGVELINNNNSKTMYQLFPLSFDIMTHFVYQIGTGKCSPYLLVGPNIKLPIQKNVNSSDGYNTNTDFAIDFGIGLANRTRYFIFAPELRYSLGLLNVNGNPIVPSLNFHNVSLVLNFK